MRLESLGAVGNCQVGALVEDTGSLVWLCMPSFDSEPVCGRLLDPDGGDFTLGPAEGGRGTQRYLDNTNVLETTFSTPEGGFRVLDFAPRFELFSRMYRPTQLLRVIEPLHGAPRVRAHFRPVEGWSKRPATALHASHHIHFGGALAPLRLTTDLPLSWLEGRPFVLTGPRRFALTWNAPVEEPLSAMVDKSLGETVRYWRRWVKQCNIPPQFQKEVIRSALALKLCCHEDTGAIVAALTSSIPEAPGSGRTWDYRYCWLRDAFYTLDALRLLGQFDERQAFTDYLLSLAATGGPLELKPLYKVDGTQLGEEMTLTNWQGFEGHGPVRVGNAAASHVQHDVYGEMVLALTPVYFDERFAGERSHATLDLLHRLAARALEVAGTADAGLWEYRTGWREHTFSTVMCWAAAERAGRIGGLQSQNWAAELTASAEKLRTGLLARAWSDALGSFTVSPGMEGVDAALLQLPSLRILKADDLRLHKTIDTAWKALERDGGWLLRYQTDDGFGVPTVAFTLCTFWLAQALAVLGRRAEAREVLKRVQPAPNPLGLWSEDIEPRTGRLWGNFPQAYSHVGLIHAAFASAPDWSELI
jgi:GH15 family glucan-1,4-alpha-glucosidase